MTVKQILAPSSLTEQRKAEFLRLLSTGETVMGACRAMNLPTTYFYQPRYRRDPEFHAAWTAAYMSSTEARAKLVHQRNFARPAAKSKLGAPPPGLGGKKRDPIYRNKFLAALARGSSVTRAAEQADVSYASVLIWRRDDADFAAQWDLAVQQGIDVLEDSAFRRAVDGVPEPVFYEGRVVGTRQVYSDALLALMLRSKHAQYRRVSFNDDDGSGNHVTVGSINVISVPPGTFLSPEEIAALTRPAIDGDPPAALLIETDDKETKQ